ncbi:MAG: hypothetical protein JWL80_110 [Parcubacteria group bacterium]|nr:hypothetical protein [Parcubacteria group bacterium]
MKSSQALIDLMSGIIMLASSLIILLFFTTFNITDIFETHFALKPGYSSWAWAVFSLSSLLNSYVRSNSTINNQAYINPIFKWSLKIASRVSFAGLILSLIPRVMKDGNLKNIVSFSSTYLDMILIFFVIINLTSGIVAISNAIKNYHKRSKKPEHQF